jgi:hypothetical protein
VQLRGKHFDLDILMGGDMKFNSLSHIRRRRWSSSMIMCSGSILTRGWARTPKSFFTTSSFRFCDVLCIPRVWYILMGGDMKFLQLGLGGSLCNYSCPWCRVHKNQSDDMTKPLEFYHTRFQKLFIVRPRQWRPIQFTLSTLFCPNVKRNAASSYFLSKPS